MFSFDGKEVNVLLNDEIEDFMEEEAQIVEMYVDLISKEMNEVCMFMW